ncbi:MAG: zinc-dependent alcohol dehydrogenase [Spirochaetaceae bacterium]
MKAIRITGKNEFGLQEIEAPGPKPEEALIKVRATGVCGTDLELCDGSMFYLTTGMSKLPLTPGHEWTGEIVELGSEVRGFAVGDRVVGECTVSCGECDMCHKGWYNHCPNRTETGILNRDGGFAEYLTYPAAFLHKTNGLSWEAAATIEPTAVSLQPVKAMKVSPADYVAVMGPGPIGLLAVQIAKAYGARKVILVGTRDERLEVGRQMGADETVNVRTENIKEKVADITRGRMVDVVVEAAGKPGVWQDIAAILAPRARVGITGLFAGKTCEVDFDPLVVGQVSIHGFLGSPDMWEESISLHERGLIDPAPIITHRLPLEEFAEAVDISRTRRENAIKVMVLQG